MDSIQPTGELSWRKKLVLLLLLCVVVPLGLLALLEGGSSLALLARELWSIQIEPLPERQHVQYDSVLGWVSRPNLSLPDMYGPGLYLQTNGQGFRNNEDVPRQGPAGKVRAICTGDSFTFGIGVGNDHTWCALLATLIPRLETVNLGQGGYGVDQAYLRYLRDGAGLEHKLVLFAFIGHNFVRMQTSSFNGYPKPVLALENGELAVHNVPVPRKGPLGRWATRAATTLSQLRLLQLVRGIANRGAATPTDTDSPVDSTTWKVAHKLFVTLAAAARSERRTLVLVYLPSILDYRRKSALLWSGQLGRLERDEGIPVIDLVSDFRALPPHSARTLFDQPGEIVFDAQGHYNPAGNRWVAERLREHLLRSPETVAVLRGP